MSRAHFLAAAALLAATLAVPGAAAQSVTITGLAQELDALDSTTDVRLIRFADFTEQASVRVGEELAPGDQLSSVSGKTTLELRCPEGSLLRFSGPFRLLLDAPESGDCAINFLSGTLNVLTDKRTEIEAGGVLLGSEGTHYEVELRSGATRGDARRVRVYDGRVWMRMPSTGLHARLAQGWALALPEPAALGDVEDDAVEVAKTPIAPRDLAASADRMASFEASQALRREPAALRVELAAVLRTRYQAVLENPDDLSSRLELAQVQQANKVDLAGTYHTRRAVEQIERAAGDSESTVEGLKIDPGTFKTLDLKKLETQVPRMLVFPPSPTLELDPSLLRWQTLEKKSREITSPPPPDIH